MFEFEFNELFRTYFQNSSDLISNLMFMNADQSKPLTFCYQILAMGRLPPGVNFINILQAAFAAVDPKRVKRYL